MKPMEFFFIGKSKRIDDLRKQIAKNAKGENDLLVIGEIGTGKGSIARYLHDQSVNGDSSVPFVSLNAAVLDDRELAAGLFGFVRGVKGMPPTTKKGVFERAAGGTVLIEEIEEASYRNQKKLLEFLNERKTIRLGSDAGVEVNVRLILTLKSAPVELLEANKLYEGLYEKLRGFSVIQTAPLRDRKEDIPHLVKHFVSHICGELGIKDVALDINAIDILTRHNWRENFRELKAVVDKAVLFSSEGKFVLPPELSDEKTEVVKMINNVLGGQAFVLDNSLDVIEKGIIERALSKFGFNQSKAAHFLGMTEQTLRYKLKRLGIASARQR